MNNTAKPEKFRKLSIMSLVFGVSAIPVTFISFIAAFFYWLANEGNLFRRTIPSSVYYMNGALITCIPGFIFSITAVVFGIITIKIKAYRNMSILGIVMGAIVIIFCIWFMVNR